MLRSHQQNEAPASPRIGFRLTAPECTAIASGLLLVQYLTDQNRLAESDPQLDQRINDLSNVFMGLTELLGYTHMRVCTAKTHRVRLDALQIAFSMFAVRRLRKEIRGRLIKVLFWPEGLLFYSIIHKLERFRKRAKRAWLSTPGGGTAYHDWYGQWHRFLGVVRQDGETLRRWKTIPNFSAARRDAIFNVTKQILVQQKFPNMPDDSTLRYLALKMCRDAKRGRKGASILDLSSANDRVRQRVRNYMEKEIMKLRGKLEAALRADVNSPLAKQEAALEEEFKDDKALAGVDWFSPLARKMSLQQLQQMCRDQKLRIR